MTHLFQIRFATKNFIAKFFIKAHSFRLIHQKLNSKGFFQPLVVTYSFEFNLNFLAKFFIKVQNFPDPGGDTFLFKKVQSLSIYKKRHIIRRSHIFWRSHFFRQSHVFRRSHFLGGGGSGGGGYLLTLINLKNINY